ncbi:acyltransferase [Nocardioides sp. CER19]|uniref:acyltransferase family protein n=1 Tax=Nocardioides sp. CER19 TaxID=3038538 RepID=UPI00244CBDDB|nr:acyltransferase [Nocardioides sp. CER19]MDH2416635.1 acyltransferase [Nocardioides sp. CER19]
MSQQPAPRVIPALDAMRAVGALAVVATHCGFNAGIYGSGTLGHLVARLDVGVAVFFVLSGFLLSREWLVRAATDRPAPGARHYLWKRLLRIYPAYVVTVVVAMVLIPENRGASPREWLITLGMAGIYTDDPLPRGLSQTWSLATEVAFYLVLPLLMWIVVGRRIRRLRVLSWLVVFAAVACWWLLDLSGRLPLGGTPVNEWLPAYLTWFGAGIGLAAVHTSPGLFPRATTAMRALGRSPGACWTAAIGVLMVATTPLAGPTALVPATPAEALVKNLLYLVVGVLLIVSSAFGEGSYARVLSHPTARHLGRISYSVFLIHMSVLQLVMWITGYPLFGGHFLAIFGLTLVLTLPASELIYRVVERPFMRLRREPFAGEATASAAPSATTAA